MTPRECTAKAAALEAEALTSMSARMTADYNNMAEAWRALAIKGSAVREIRLLLLQRCWIQQMIDASDRQSSPITDWGSAPKFAE